jgi:hypothetical protein
MLAQLARRFNTGHCVRVPAALRDDRLGRRRPIAIKMRLAAFHRAT